MPARPKNVTIISGIEPSGSFPGGGAANEETGLAGNAWPICARKRTWSSYGSRPGSVCPSGTWIWQLGSARRERDQTHGLEEVESKRLPRQPFERPNPASQ